MRSILFLGVFFFSMFTYASEFIVTLVVFRADSTFYNLDLTPFKLIEDKFGLSGEGNYSVQIDDFEFSAFVKKSIGSSKLMSIAKIAQKSTGLRIQGSSDSAFDVYENNADQFETTSVTIDPPKPVVFRGEKVKSIGAVVRRNKPF